MQRLFFFTLVSLNALVDVLDDDNDDDVDVDDSHFVIIVVVVVVDIV